MYFSKFKMEYNIVVSFDTDYTLSELFYRVGLA